MELDRIYNMDCLEGMQQIPRKYIDMIIVDPPYSTPVITAFGRKKEKNYGDLSIQRNFFMQIKKQFERILKEKRPVFIFCDSKYYPILFEIFYSWQTNQLLIWDKGRIGLGSPFRKQYELIYFVSKEYGLQFNNGITLSDILKCEIIPSNDRLVGSQKPTELLNKLISAFTKEGDIILDCFMGSGTTAISCKQINRHFIGFEINPEYCEIAEKRIKGVPERLETFEKHSLEG